jgi:hypothetical protein
MLALSYAATAALVVTPTMAPVLTPAPARPPVLMAHTSRRALLAGGVAALATPLAARASLQSDQQALRAEEEAVSSIDALLKKARDSAFYDEIALEAKKDAWLDALKRGDGARQGQLLADIRALESKYAAEEAAVLDLTSKEATEATKESALRAQVRADQKAELALETREMLEGERAYTRSQVRSEEPDVAAKFLG